MSSRPNNWLIKKIRKESVVAALVSSKMCPTHIPDKIRMFFLQFFSSVWYNKDPICCRRLYLHCWTLGLAASNAFFPPKSHSPLHTGTEWTDNNLKPHPKRYHCFRWNTQPSWGLTFVLCVVGECLSLAATWATFLPISVKANRLLGFLKTNWLLNITAQVLFNQTDDHPGVLSSGPPQIYSNLRSCDSLDVKWHFNGRIGCTPINGGQIISQCTDGACLPCDPWHLCNPQVLTFGLSAVSPACRWMDQLYLNVWTTMMMMPLRKVICHQSCCCTPT